MEDPRIDRTRKHPLESILYIVLCGTIAEVDSWIGYQDYAEEHMEILKTFIDLPNGAPSHDTFARAVERLDPNAFGKCFERFVSILSSQSKGVIAVDGKAIRGYHDQKNKSKHVILFQRGQTRWVLYWPRKK